MKILFLCHANMCRSPLAEGLLKLILKKHNIEATVDSAGFEVFHINESPDAWAIKKAKENGIDISAKKVRMFKRDDFDLFDKIYVMDTLSYQNAKHFARNEDDMKKVDYLMNVIKPGKNESVPDSFYRSLDAGDEMFEILQSACEKIVESISKEQLN